MAGEFNPDAYLSSGQEFNPDAYLGVPSQQVESDIPTEANLAIQPPAQAERGIGDYIEGAVDTALTLGTGATGGALGYAVGSGVGAIGELTGMIEEGEGEKMAQEYSSALTRMPKSEVGQEMVQGIGETLGYLPPVLGITPVSQLNRLIPNKTITPKMLKSKSVKNKIIADEILAGNTNTETIKKMLDPKGNAVTNKPLSKAIDVIGKDKSIGGVRASDLAVLLSLTQGKTKGVVKNMLNDIEHLRSRPDKKLLTTSFNRAGDVMLDRAKTVFDLNEKASKKIGAIAKGTKKNIDLSEPIGKFESALSDMGVTLKTGDDGWVTPDFSRSRFKGGNRESLGVLINDLKDGNMNFEKAHSLKQELRENVNYDTLGSGKMADKSAKVLNDLAKEVNELLRVESPAYEKANAQYAKTIEAKNQFDTLMGKDISITDPEANLALGARARSLNSENINKTPLLKLLRTTDEAVESITGKKFNDDLHSLVDITTRIENIFKLEPEGSIKGIIKQRGSNVVQGQGATGEAIGALIQGANELSTPDFNKKMAAIKVMLNQKQ